MRFACLIIALCVLCGSGCMTARLRQRTINQGSTLPELQYQQVLGNLAMFADNPAALPWHVNLREGTTQLTDSINAGSLVDLGPPAVTQAASLRLAHRGRPVGHGAGDRSHRAAIAGASPIAVRSARPTLRRPNYSKSWRTS